MRARRASRRTTVSRCRWRCIGPIRPTAQAARCVPSVCRAKVGLERAAQAPRGTCRGIEGAHEESRGEALIRQRSQSVERSFADQKEHRGLRKFSGRGQERAAVQAGLSILQSRRGNDWVISPTRNGFPSHTTARAAFLWDQVVLPAIPSIWQAWHARRQGKWARSRCLWEREVQTVADTGETSGSDRRRRVNGSA